MFLILTNHTFDFIASCTSLRSFLESIKRTLQVLNDQLYRVCNVIYDGIISIKIKRRDHIDKM